MPFSLLALLPSILGAAGSIAGGAAAGRAKGRSDEANLLQQQDQGALQRYQGLQSSLMNQAQMQNQNAFGQADRDLQRRQFGEDAPLSRYRQSIMGNLASNMQDVSASHPRANVVHFSGGARPSAIGEGGRAAGSELANQAYQRLLAGDKFDPIQTTNFNVLTPPAQSKMPQSSWFDKLLSGLSYGGAGATALQGLGIGNPSPQTPGAQTGLPPNMGGTSYNELLQPPPNLASKNIFWDNFGQLPDQQSMQIPASWYRR